MSIENIYFSAYAYEHNMHIQLDLGRGAIFSGLDCPDLMRAPLRQKLEWSLSDVRDTVEDAAHADWKWIIKPSVTNKGYNFFLNC